MWSRRQNQGLKQFFDGPFIFDSDSEDNSSTFQYIGDRRNNCSFKINQVEHDHADEYAFRFETNSPDDKFTGKPGSTLKIVGKFVLFLK